MRRFMSTRKIVAPPITSFSSKDERYVLFGYFLELSCRCGANKFNNKLLNTDPEELFRLTRQINPEDIKVKDDHSQSILHLAAQYCRGEDMAILLDAKFKGEAELDAVDDLGYTPLFYAAMANNVDVAEVLVEKECDLNIHAGGSKRSALHVAAMFGCKEMARFLLQKKCAINCQDSMGLTPVTLAAYYRHSDVTAFLIAMGADPFVVDIDGTSSAIRIAFTMPIIIRDVFDKLCTEDLLKGERSYDLEQILETEGVGHKTSFFQFLVWQSNLGIVEHPVFKHLTEAKWMLYGEKPTKKTFDNEVVEKEEMYVYYGHLSVYIAALACYFQRLKVNTLLVYRRHMYLIHIKRIMTSMDETEASIMHPKGKHLLKAAKKATKAAKMTFIDDIKKAPSLFTDLIIDHILLLYLVLKVFSVFNQRIASIENIFGAIAIICLWTNTFLKLQMTKRIGPFVIFMKYVPSDMWTVCTMFITLFMPAFLVFYKTIFMKDGMKIEVDEEVVEGVTGRVRRAAAKGGSGGDGEYSKLNIIGTLFAVLRMVLVDYEYEDGLSRSKPPLWWMIISIVWILVSSIIVLNLMIAIMADSYTRIYERSEISSRARRAQTLADLERKMDPKELSRAIETIMKRCPIKILFDPVCDRDKIERVNAKVQLLTKKVGRLEQTVTNKLFINFKRRLDFIETKINIESYKPTTAAPFFRYS